MINILSKGNNKLDKSILCWSITPIKSCPVCTSCKNTCYAVNPYKRWPNVKKAWDRNFSLAKRNLHIAPIVKQLANSKCKVVRIHVSGDFFSQDYIDSWVSIAEQFPEIKFYSYSKTIEMFDFTKLMELPNVNIINSICPDDGNNYGTKERVNMLRDKWEYFICQAVENPAVKCGKTCKVCQVYDKVCFPEHK